MNLEILLACMYQKDTDIVRRSKICSDVLIINQCDKDSYKEENNGFKIRMISTRERGLSRSRNMALEQAKGDICLICDDDEIFENGYGLAIIQAFVDFPRADVITFSLNHPTRKFPSRSKKIGYIGALKTCSLQIAFRRESVLNKGIRFDTQMGSGTGNGGGEENKFLIDCIKKGLKIRFVPIVIATVGQASSQWFKGHTNQFFLNRGWTNRRLLGLLGAWLYAIEYSVVKYPKYKKDNTFWRALYYQLKGSLKK